VTRRPASGAEDVDETSSGYRCEVPLAPPEAADSVVATARAGEPAEPVRGEVHVVLLRRVIGDALRARRQGQHRTLREVSTAANVSLGYLSEIERGQKEASSELLAAICEALGAQLSDLLREVSDTLALAEQLSDVALPAGEQAMRPAESTPSAPSQPRLVPVAERGDPRVPASTEQVPAAAEPVPADAEPASAPAPVPTVAEPVPAGAAGASASASARHAATALSGRAAVRAVSRVPAKGVDQDRAVRTIDTDGRVAVSVRQDSPLRATLHARPLRPVGREVVPVA
jgi:transcriptional regulator with XRE-family HTH domain